MTQVEAEPLKLVRGEAVVIEQEVVVRRLGSALEIGKMAIIEQNFTTPESNS